ncbi:MAG: hypothetical protein K2Q01_07400, partial [Rickettsiales bacterium]|nr:hypothetical protein [Rickettsiales bacterium]
MTQKLFLHLLGTTAEWAIYEEGERTAASAFPIAIEDLASSIPPAPNREIIAIIPGADARILHAEIPAGQA